MSPFRNLVAGAGFEPTTFGLWARRATRLLHPASALQNYTQEIYFFQSIINRYIEFLAWLSCTLIKMVAGAGFEPTTFGLWARRATRLLHPASALQNYTQEIYFFQSIINWYIEFLAWLSCTLIKMVAGAGFEPTTFGLWARRATRLLHPATTLQIHTSSQSFNLNDL